MGSDNKERVRIHYRILQENNLEALEAEVNNFISENDGWKPTGGIIHTIGSIEMPIGTYNMFAQAMTDLGI